MVWTLLMSIIQKLISTVSAVSTCGLDFSHVNTNVNSFIIFFLVLVLVVPFLGFTYFFIRTAHTLCCTTRILEHSESTHGIQHYIVIILTVLITFLLFVPHFVVNILAGRGHVISGRSHFLSNMCHISVSTVLTIVYALVHRLPTLLQYFNVCICQRSCNFVIRKQETSTPLRIIVRKLVQRIPTQ